MSERTSQARQRQPVNQRAERAADERVREEEMS
jgi:hypothetical protein